MDQCTPSTHSGSLYPPPRSISPTRSVATFAVSFAMDALDPARAGRYGARRHHAFRLRDGAARPETGARRRRVSFGRAPLRPDERPDVGGAAPGLEERACRGCEPV